MGRRRGRGFIIRRGGGSCELAVFFFLGRVLFVMRGFVSWLVFPWIKVRGMGLCVMRGFVIFLSVENLLVQEGDRKLGWVYYLLPLYSHFLLCFQYPLLPYISQSHCFRHFTLAHPTSHPIFHSGSIYPSPPPTSPPLSSHPHPHLPPTSHPQTASPHRPIQQHPTLPSQMQDKDSKPQAS